MCVSMKKKKARTPKLKNIPSLTKLQAIKKV